MFNSIKRRLAILFLLVFSLVFAGLEFFQYYEIKTAGIRLVDDHLKSSNQTLANILTIEESHGQIKDELQELNQTATGEYALKLSGHYYQITGASDSRALARSPSLSLAGAYLPLLQPSDEPRYDTITGPDGQRLRMITRIYRFRAGILIFQTAESLDDVSKLASSLRDLSIVIYPILFALCGIGVFIISSWALRPLKAFSAKLSRITEANLSERVEEKGLAAEIKPLAVDFNTMMGRLEASFTRQKQFLSDASHELRTPTSIIKSFCDVTLGRTRSADDYREAIKKISETVNRMCGIINRILVISRLDGKEMRFSPSKVDLLETLKDVVRLIEPMAAGKGVRITLEHGVASVSGDREGLTEVFTNMVENAVKYNKQGGSVYITAAEEADTAVVTVKDTGIGIPAGETNKIFDRFYRIDESRSRTIGSGLGLSIVRSIVESHGGSIDVKSTVGIGSEFTIRLPKDPVWKNNGAAHI
ncbi:MAG: HAMP domain-containing protein [Deltaproteobacteria bacterium]|nr:HAMP domain-containing protein [Deltaproteobacteria bacterium]